MPDSLHTLAPRCREREPSTPSAVGSVRNMEVPPAQPTAPQRHAGEATTDDAPEPAGAWLLQLRGTGPEFAGVLHTEAFFRSFSNRRQVAYLLTIETSPSVRVLGYWSHQRRWEDIDDMGGCVLPLDQALDIANNSIFCT